MRAAFRIGLKVHEYDEMTPHELNMMIEEWVAREKKEDRRHVEGAYLSALYNRVKKFPSADKVFGTDKKEQAKKQTAADMLAEVKRLNEALGGTTY
ncbi:hypothetical protein [Paenibacillus sp. MMO-58]|uniref:hypothetical protein n=1 Tax=Paenibacillus sp. MMO-58 TaxID=3081290 RepID=UPI00301B601E